MSDGALAATQYYHELLTSGRFDDTLARLQTGIEAGKLHICGSPASRVLRPFFVDEPVYAAAMATASEMAYALGRLRRHLLGDAALRAVFALPPEVDEICALEPPESLELAGRLDGFLSATGSLDFMEFNSMGVGMVFNDALAELFSQMPILAAVKQRFAVHHIPTAERVLPAVQRGLASLRPAVTKPTIAIILSEPPSAGSLAMPETGRLLGRAQQQGLRVLIADANDLEFQDGCLKSQGVPIDVAFIDWLPSFLKIARRDHPFWRAIAARAVWSGTPLSAQLLCGDKRAFVFLSDERYRPLFGDALFAKIAHHVPWTRIMQPGWSTHAGTKVDLLEFVRTQRERFVLKPAADYGGKGICCGWETDAAFWDEMMEAALTQPYVVQERIIAPQEIFPIDIAGRMELRDCYVDLSPFVWNEQSAAGALVRVSGHSLMNVTAGHGSLTPLFVVPG